MFSLHKPTAGFETLPTSEQQERRAGGSQGESVEKNDVRRLGEGRASEEEELMKITDLRYIHTIKEQEGKTNKKDTQDGSKIAT